MTKVKVYLNESMTVQNEAKTRRREEELTRRRGEMQMRSSHKGTKARRRAARKIGTLTRICRFVVQGEAEVEFVSFVLRGGVLEEKRTELTHSLDRRGPAWTSGSRAICCRVVHPARGSESLLGWRFAPAAAENGVQNCAKLYLKGPFSMHICAKMMYFCTLFCAVCTDSGLILLVSQNKFTGSLCEIRASASVNIRCASPAPDTFRAMQASLLLYRRCVCS